VVVHPIKGPEGLEINNGGEIILRYDELLEKAKQTKFCERLRAIHPVIFVLTLLTYRSAHKIPTIRELWQEYVKMAGADGNDPSNVVTYQSFYEKFNEELVVYLESILSTAMNRLEQNSTLKLQGKLDEFASVYIQDNTIVRLHEKLSALFPAARTRIVGKTAGFKVAVMFNAASHGPSSISIVPERTPDIKTLKIGKWIKDCLIILDLGFYKHWNFYMINKFGGYFLVRLKSNAKPIVKRIFLPNADELYNEYIGLPVCDVLPHLPHGPVAMEVSVSFRRRKYRKKVGRVVSTSFFCIANFNQEKEKWHIYLTNLSPKKFSVEEICALYAFRWTIELLFKEMKSDNELGQQKSVNKFLSESLIYIAILRTIISREFYLLVNSHQDPVKNTPSPPLLWSRIFIEHLPEMRSILRKEIKFGCWLNKKWNELLESIFGNSIPIKCSESKLPYVTGF